MKKAFVIGSPISHSRSPLIHNFWIKNLKIEGTYQKKLVSPGDLPSFLNSMMSNHIAGCNVTIPHKEQVFKLVTVLDPITKAIGAVNTIYQKDEILFGLNTDGYGFISNLKENTQNWAVQDKTAVIIGAGGAARAIIAILISENIKIIKLVNRTVSKAVLLKDHFGRKVQAHSFKDLPKILKKCDLLVNTTSLGMVGQPPLDISLENLPKQCVVTDIVYDPLQTELLKQAKKRGNITVDGLGMLLHQAVPGFEKWFGIRPDVTSELRQMIVKDLQKEQSR